jgi:hypothetical protein
MMRRFAESRYFARRIVFSDPARWKVRAEEARALASQLGDVDTREALRGIAAAYESMAVKAAAPRKIAPSPSVGMAAE